MSEIIARVATTALVERGGTKTRITREALESMAQQVATSRAIPITVNHDPFSLPIGKIAEAWIEPFGDEYALMARVHIEDTYSALTHRRSGVDFVRSVLYDDNKPLGSRSYGKTDEVQNSLSVDSANFASPQDYEAFANQVGDIDDTICCDSRIHRYSLGPEPVLQLVLSNPEISAAVTVGVWTLRRAEKFVRYTVDETLRKVADEISDSLSLKIKSIWSAFISHRSHDKRASLAQIVILGDTELILLVKTEVNEEFPTIHLTKLTEEMEKYGDILQEAESAILARAESNDWEFLYLTTRSGQVIGTVECYERTIELIRGMTETRKREGDHPES